MQTMYYMLAGHQQEIQADRDRKLEGRRGKSGRIGARGPRDDWPITRQVNGRQRRQLPITVYLFAGNPTHLTLLASEQEFENVIPDTPFSQPAMCSCQSLRQVTLWHGLRRARLASAAQRLPALHRKGNVRTLQTIPCASPAH